MRETQVQSLGQEDPLEKEMATHSSILAWRIPRTEEPAGLQLMASQGVGHALVMKPRLPHMRALLSQLAHPPLPPLCPHAYPSHLRLHSCLWAPLEFVMQSEASQKEKQKYRILTLYAESRKMILISFYEHWFFPRHSPQMCTMCINLNTQ